MSVRVCAPAKINLTLQVGRARADGLHPLQSAVVFADVGDWIEAHPADALTLSVVGPFAPALQAEHDNLVLRAARALAAAAGVENGARLVLEKNLPVASGMGGGSSDAAATLKALAQIWNVRLSENEIMRIGAEIGGDVPVCVFARSAWVSGVGEQVAPLQTPVMHAVLANPLEPVATARVFGKFDEMQLGGDFAPAPPPAWRTTEDVVAAAAGIGNDLAAPARALLPAIADIETTLAADRRVKYAGLSGSGATCFALVADAAAANALASELSARRRDWWVRATRFGAA